MDESIVSSSELPPGIERAHSKEKSTIQGHPAAIHSWWGRRSGAFSRIATYLALTQRRDVSPSFFEALAAYPPSAKTLTIAARHIRDTQWRQAWKEATGPQISSRPGQHDAPELPTPRILDPFCGTGGIALEAARLGCSAYASDLSPVACNITRATSYFPGKFGSPDPTSIGTNQAGKWAGLAQELSHWTDVVTSIVDTRIETFFPDNESHTFIWFHAAQCPSCDATMPLQLSHPLARGKSPVEIVLSAEGSALRKDSAADSVRSSRRRHLSVCPGCGFSGDLTHSNSSSGVNPILAAVSTDNGFQTVKRSETCKYYKWESQFDQRIRETKDSGWQTLDLPLPQVYTRTGSLGCETFADLFTPRQRLVALEYATAVREVAEQMKNRGIAAERVQAIVTYLAFLVDFIVERNSKLCRWNPTSRRAESTLVIMNGHLPRVFTEVHPRKLVAQWLDRILPALVTLCASPAIESATCSDAKRLPYPENFFDAVITDPPYFDNIPYSELPDYFWVWEQPLFDFPKADEISATSYVMEEIQSHPNSYLQDVEDRYWRGYRASIGEIYRVLKPGNLFTLFITAPTASVFDTYISLSQEAGFELFNIQHMEDAGSTGLKHRTYLVYFRKPHTQNNELKSETINASQILEAVESNRPLLYEGLAQLLLDELDEVEIQGLLTEEYKGTTLERLMEVLADRDLRELFVGLFGDVGIRKLVKKLGLAQSDEPVIPVDRLLSRFGFSTPTPRALWGAHQVGSRLRQLISRVDLAEEKAIVRGLFLEGSTSLEQLFRSTVWAWASLAFGEDRNTELLRVLQESPEGKGRHYSLDRLSFGNIAALFRRLPDAIAQSSMSPLIERKLGRHHVYNPVEKQSKLSGKLDELISIRNKIEHDKESFWTNADLGTAKRCVSDGLSRSVDLVSSMVRNRATPAWAYVSHQIQDAWSRTTYRLLLDDGSLAEARFTHDLNLGGIYLYFGGDVNPRPVDPLIVSSEWLQDV
jgi:hypothetical protein